MSEEARLVLPSRRKEPYISVTCPYTDCRAAIEFLPPTAEDVQSLPASETSFSVACVQCKRNFAPPSASKLLREARSKSKRDLRRRIGTDEHPLDMTYYDLLEVSSSATVDEIKKAYRKKAIRLHPDKNPNKPEVEERFKALAAAYQVLSDPETRHKYNEFGPTTPGLVNDDQMVDPEEVFGSLFGGPKFQDIIGTISIGRDMKEELQKDSEQLYQEAEQGDGSGDGDKAGGAQKNKELSPEEKAAREEQERKAAEVKEEQRAERVKELAEKLARKLSIYTESVSSADDEDVAAEARRGFHDMMALDAEELKQENFGVELLHTVGFIYTGKSRHYLAANGMFGSIGGIFHSAASSFHTVRETVSTVRAALELKSVFEELAKAEEQGITEERKKQLEEQAAEKGMRAVFKGAKLEVESVLREVTERVLYDPEVPKPTQRLRAEALGVLGEVFSAVKGDDEKKDSKE